VQQPDNRQGVEFVRAQTLHWIKQGLRASLKIGNILTGGLYVDIRHYDVEQPDTIDTFLGYDVIPSADGEFAQITQKVTDLLDTISSIPFQQMGTNASDLLATLDKTALSFKQTALALEDILSEFKDQQTSENINQAVSSLNKLLSDYSAGSQTQQELVNTLQSFQSSLQQLTPLLQQLNQTPNSLIFADGTEPVIEPKAKENEDD
jgi:paraquat-inducible protein B